MNKGEVGKARREYEQIASALHGAALEAFEDAVARGREKAEHDVRFEG